jgi:hypothetical protein
MKILITFKKGSKKMKLRTCFVVLLIICSLSMFSGNILANTNGTNTYIENVSELSKPIQICRGGGFSSRGSSGGSRSYRSSTTKSAPSKSPVKSAPSKTITGTKNKNTTRSLNNKNSLNKSKTKTETGNKPARKLNRADKKLAEKAKKSGNYYKDRKSATADFKAKNAGKYPSKYTSQPTTRPSHIPQSTRVGTTNVNINYNPMYGGYGYMHLGAWVMYDAMADTIMMNSLMHQHGVFIASEHGVVRPYYQNPLSIMFSIILLCFVIWFMIYMCSKHENDGYPDN